MQTFTERATTLLLAENAFAPAAPGFIGAALDFIAPDVAGQGRRTLRHGFLDRRGGGVTVSVPPSPGLESCVVRLAEDLHLGAASADSPSGDFVQSRHDVSAGSRGGVRVAIEAGIDAAGPAGISFRWRLAHQLAPVLAAAFAASPGNGWRSRHQARHRHLPVVPAQPDPRQAWAAHVMDAPSDARARALSAGHRTLRAWTRSAAAPSLVDVGRYAAALRPPVAARGHLEISVADLPPGNAWRVPVAVIAALLDDPIAAEQADAATSYLADEQGLWERAARDALSDVVLADAARSVFLLAYGVLGGQGVDRGIRDAVAEYAERYVLRGRTPADDPTQLPSGAAG